MVMEENGGAARLGEVREALQQELCTSYSAIVGLETQIQAVQRRQHLLQMDDKGADTWPMGMRVHAPLPLVRSAAQLLVCAASILTAALKIPRACAQKTAGLPAAESCRRCSMSCSRCSQMSKRT
jgi:hypothetical protein